MLSLEQILERRKGIGASDAKRICDGDWHNLFLEKTGRAEGPDLSDVFAVQLGHATEQLNLDWYERRTGRPVEDRGAAVLFQEWPVLRCTLDGFDPVERCVVEAKHVNGFSKMEDVVARYTPQVQHQMIVRGVQKAILSVIVGANEPVLEPIAFDEFWTNEYIEKCREFWRYVEEDHAPEQGAPMEIAPAMPISDMRTVDMAGNNAWTNFAADWITHNAAAKTFKKAETELKALVEPDVREAFGAGIKISRNKAGSLSIKEVKS